MAQGKYCAVCGDRAQSNNFNAITCESCKAFFRRNALAKKELNCLFNQNCEITVVTRKFCQKCRLKKCLDVGMKSENIMTEEDKQMKRLKIEINRKRKKRKLNHHTEDRDENKQSTTACNPSGNHTGKIDETADEFCLETNDYINGIKANKVMELKELTADVMNAKELVDFIICNPDRSSQAINQLMSTSTDALIVIRNIFTSEDNALRLISYLIQFPGDALRILNKIMTSPLDALTLIANLLSSPTDALEIIAKILDCPKSVLRFLTELLDAPEDAVNIWNKFQNMPAEAIRIIKNAICDTTRDNLHSITINNNNVEESNIQVPCMTHFDPHQMPASSEMNKFSHNKTIKVPDEFPIEDEILPTVLFTEKVSNNNDNLNSLGSVLSEVVRIEYEIFESEPTPSQVYVKKQHCCQPDDHFLNASNTNSLFQQNEFNVETASYQINSIMTASNCLQQTTYRQLNDVELMKLRELKMASEALYLPVDNDLSALMSDDRIKSEDNCQNPKLVQVINLTAVAIKRLIKMAKKITAFRNMCQEDQIALLKGGCTEMMIIRSVTNYDYDRNTWRIPHTKEDMSNIRAEVLKLAKGNVYEEHLKFMTSFDEKWRLDENIILIICAIVLFTPNRSCAVHRDVIRMEQNSYYYLLRRYLESIYEGCEAKSAFMKLMQKIADVARLNQFIIGVYLNVNPSLVEPLLREIFDLKNINI